MPESQYQSPLPKLEQTCSACGKPKHSANRGTITSWIFQERCDCKSARDLRYDEVVEQASISLKGQIAKREDAFSAQEQVQRQSPEQVDLGDRYEVMSLIGQGGMGSVYKIRDKVLDQQFAAKVLHQDLRSDGAGAKRFEREIACAKHLTSSHIIATYASGTTSRGCPFAVMDLLKGEDLAAVLRAEGMLMPERALPIFIQICEAVEHAHKKGVLHRDLKPGNIFLTRGSDSADFVKVIDFGIAQVTRAADIGAESLTMTGEIIGSPLYMSPEQCIGEPMSERSDIYSIGCIMYECLTGQSPFNDANPVKIILRHISDERPKPANQVLRPDSQLPAALEQIIVHCLERDSTRRYQLTKTLREDLELVRDGMEVPRFMSPGHKFGKRPPVLLLAFAVLLVGLAVGGGYGINLLISNNHPVAMSVSGGSGQAQALPAGAQFMTANELLEAGHLAAGAPPEKRNKLTVYSYYEAGLSKLRAQMPADPAILMKGLRGYGEDLLAIGAFDKAEEVFGEALGLGQTAGDKRFCADCNDHIFVADMNLKLYAKSTQSATQEFELEQAIDPLSDLSVVAASNVAISYFSRGQEYYKTAQDWFEKVHKMTPREPNVDSVVMTKGYAYQYQAIMAEKLGNRQQAGELFEKALPTFKKFPGANSQILKSHYQEMIKHYILTGDKKRADMYQNEAAKLVKG